MDGRTVHKALLTEESCHGVLITFPDVQSEIEALGSQVRTEPKPKQRSQWGIASSLSAELHCDRGLRPS